MLTSKLKCVLNRPRWNILRTFSTEYYDKSNFSKTKSSHFINLQYENWRRDPFSVEACWDYLFQNSAREISTGQGLFDDGGGGGADSNTIDKHLAVQTLIRSYQTRGHLVANLDPLKITKIDHTSPEVPIQERKSLQLTDADMNTNFRVPPHITYIGGKDATLPLKEIIARLEKVYCETIGLEYMYIYNKEECFFIRKMFESPERITVSKDEIKQLLKDLYASHGFEVFLGKKYGSEKRFGVEGGETTIPLLQKIIDTCALHGCQSFVMGMAHRARLNVLVNICHMPLSQMFAQFHGLKPEDEGSGDVKYHLGATVEHTNEVAKKKIMLCMMANPSHLETVDAVALGKCRAEQFYKKDKIGKSALTILIHGDASFSGQGIVFETMHFSDLPNYTTYGCVHIVINNQVGFTTDPRFSRSSRYCTDVGKCTNAPIFHVNGDDPEACIRVAKAAGEYRSKFHKDVIIDLVCYRRRGHNEADQPMFTQPKMYTIIEKMEPIYNLYAKECVKKGIVSQEDLTRIQTSYDDKCAAEYEISRKMKSMSFGLWLDSVWHHFFKDKPLKYPITGITQDVFDTILKKYSQPPAGIDLHKGILKILETRRQHMDKKLVDFAMAEALAFGSLLKEGVHVRLSGEDVERGTFSHRHHIVHDQSQDGKTYNFVENFFSGQAPYSVCNSSLSEYGVMGFEHGYSLVNPMSLVIWEAQFGDFMNGAQILIDCYLAAGEAKWTRQCGLVLNLPHGMDGMGPEHSSARVERFLQMCTEDEDKMPPPDSDFAVKQLKNCNWIITNCSCPSSYFHAMRRQIHLPFRKVLVNMSPKLLLRHPDARSQYSEFMGASDFKRLIADAGPASKAPDKVKKLVFCSGRVYYDLLKTRKEKKLEDIIVLDRIEQISPFPFDRVKDEVAKYPKAEVIWCQEEHKNSGCWMYVKPRIYTATKHVPKYIGRDYAAAPATGSKYQHQVELKAFLSDFVNV